MLIKHAIWTRRTDFRAKFIGYLAWDTNGDLQKLVGGLLPPCNFGQGLGSPLQQFQG